MTRKPQSISVYTGIPYWHSSALLWLSAMMPFLNLLDSGHRASPTTLLWLGGFFYCCGLATWWLYDRVYVSKTRRAALLRHAPLTHVTAARLLLPLATFAAGWILNLLILLA